MYKKHDIRTDEDTPHEVGAIRGGDHGDQYTNEQNRDSVFSVSGFTLLGPLIYIFSVSLYFLIIIIINHLFER